MAEAFGLIQWDIDHTERRIEGHLKLRVEVDDERESGR
jgi:coenzyme F420-reducing hydrogenase alpha subunit